MLRTIATPPSPRTVSYRCSAEVHGKRAEHGTKQDSLDRLGRALIATSLSRSRRPNERSKNDNVATHGRKRNRRRTRFVGSAAMHAMVNVYNRGLRPVKASYEPASKTHEYEHEHEGIGGLRRVKASYEPLPINMIMNIKLGAWMHGHENNGGRYIEVLARNCLDCAMEVLAHDLRCCSAREAHYRGHLPPPPCLPQALHDHSLPPCQLAELDPRSSHHERRDRFQCGSVGVASVDPCVAAGRWDSGAAATGTRFLG